MYLTWFVSERTEINMFQYVCITDINDCQNSPCKNGGSCVDGINDYTCICRNGYNGSNCENGKYTQPHKKFDASIYLLLSKSSAG